MPTQKAKNFKGTLRRLLGYLRPHRAALVVVVLAGAIGTVFSVLGPKILGLATTKIFEGFVAQGDAACPAPRSTSTTSAASCSG